MRAYLFIIGLIFLAIRSSGESSLFIQDAAEKNILEYNIVGSWSHFDKQEYLDANGQYFGKCLTVKLHSRIDSSVYIYFNNGLMLMCEDTATQDMIITKQIYVYLKPRQYKTIQLYAMCSEIHDGMPHRQTEYKAGGFANDSLKAIAEVIDDMFMNNIAGQGAIWAFTDKADENELRRYGANDNSIQLTIEILNRAGVVTKLNPLKTDTIPATPIDTPVVENTIDANYFSIDKNIVYLACGIGLLLLLSVIILIFRNRN